MHIITYEYICSKCCMVIMMANDVAHSLPISEWEYGTLALLMSTCGLRAGGINGIIAA